MQLDPTGDPYTGTNVALGFTTLNPAFNVEFLSINRDDMCDWIILIVIFNSS